MSPAALSGLSLQKACGGNNSYLLIPCNIWSAKLRLCVFSSFKQSLEKDEILSDVASRLWFTYRKNFPAIGKYAISYNM